MKKWQQYDPSYNPSCCGKSYIDRTKRLELRRKLCNYNSIQSRWNLHHDLEGKSAIEWRNLKRKSNGNLQEKQEQLNGDNQMLEFSSYPSWLTVSDISHRWYDQLRQSVDLRGYAYRSINRAPNRRLRTTRNKWLLQSDYDVTRIWMKSQISQNLQREQPKE